MTRPALLATLLWVGCGNLPQAPPDQPAVTVEESRADAVRRGELAAAAMAALPPWSDRPLAPYFFVDCERGIDCLPLKSTRADVKISGVIADVRVTQVYRNHAQHPIEAVYVFPASTRAAVHAVRMTVGERVIEARIRERAVAKQEFAAARAEGRTATILEQQRPNVFQMSVTNILPGDEVRVELQYAELLKRESHAYELVFPTTVGPRYTSTLTSQADERERFVESPTLEEGVPSAHTFALDARILSGVPVAGVESPSHRVKVARVSDGEVKVALPEGDDVGDRDFILRYSLEGDALDAGLLLDGENFLLMVQPPAAPAPNATVPREILFVVDVSGSMDGFPIQVAKTLMRNLISGLDEGDRFDILTFAGASELLSPAPLPATTANLRAASEFMDRQRSFGGTELLPALRRALALPRVSGLSRTVVVITDGLVTVENETFEVIRARLGEANLFAFGIGSSVNRHLIEGMARAGQGETFVATDEKAAVAAAARFRSYVRAPLLLSPRVRFEGFEAFDVEPPALPDLFAERPLIVFGKHRGGAGRVIVEGRREGGAFAETLEVSQARRSDGAGLGILWARARIERLDDRGELHKDEITRLGLEHHLLTAHTSFVAVDSVVRADGRKAETVRVPMTMPAGVSDESTIGFGAGKMGRASRAPGSYGLSGSGSGQGVLGVMKANEGSRIGSIFGRESPLGNDAENVLGGAAGSGMGGGGSAEGTIGLGNLGTIGYGGGGGLSGGRRAHAPDVQLGRAVVSGALDPQLIRKIIRAHRNELRFCYEKELIKLPSLAGRLTIRFVIDATGAVSEAAISASTMSHPAVESCVEGAVRRWKFPKPSGRITVSYPLDFKP